MKRGSRSRPSHTLKLNFFWSDGLKLESVDIINIRWPYPTTSNVQGLSALPSVVLSEKLVGR